MSTDRERLSQMINRIRPVAREVNVDEGSFTVVLMDGGKLKIPFRRFPRLFAASREPRQAVRISATGERLHWDQIEEDISVSELMRDAERRHLDERLNAQVPDDFPWDTTPALLSGTQPKLAGRWIDGRLIVGLTAAERFERWDMCEDLAQQLVPKTLKDELKFPQNSHEVTLRRIRRAIEGKNWTERVETDWLMQRLRILLGW